MNLIQAIKQPISPSAERLARDEYRHLPNARELPTITRTHVFYAYRHACQWIETNERDGLNGGTFDRLQAIVDVVEWGVYRYGTLSDFLNNTDVEELRDMILDAECAYGKFLYDRNLR